MSEGQPDKRPRRQRGPNKVQKPKMAHVSLRLPQHVVDFYNASTPAMRTVLTAWSEGKLVGSIDTTS